MPRFALLAALAAVGLASSLRARETGGGFLSSVSPADAAAAGLDQLTPAQRAALERLVEQYRSGALQAARERAAQAAAAQAAAEERARTAELAVAAARQQAAEAHVQATEAKVAEARAHAEAQRADEAVKSNNGFFARAKALITPGTRIEYAPMEAHIIGRINGWAAHSIFTLDNGQRWQVSDYSQYFNGPAVPNPRVVIRPARLTGFEMQIEGMGSMRVRLLSGPTYQEVKP